MKRIFLASSFFIVLAAILLVSAQDADIFLNTKENSKGATFEQFSDGGFKATVHEERGEIILPNKKFAGLSQGSTAVFDKLGNEKKLDLKLTEKQTLDLGGIETPLPQESEVHYDGGRYSIKLKKGSRMETSIQRNKNYKNALLDFGYLKGKYE